ncbi:MAG: hypothetical protein M0042_11155 [Nitrospiraceae bacterium]|nr:hypothetical protein [Nitrospiraceae bacterium]
MALWDKTLLNLQKGYDRITAFASVFSERLKAEINITRIRIRIDEVQGEIAEQHRLIGEKLLDARNKGDLPPGCDAFFRGDDVAAALERISLAEKGLENLRDELKGEAEGIIQSATKKEGAGE